MKKMTIVLIAVVSFCSVSDVCALWGFTDADGACFAAMTGYHIKMLVIGLLACLGVGAFGAMLWLQQLRSYGAALIATAAFLPGAATLVTVLIFLMPCTVGFCEKTYAPFWGSAIALLAWVIVAMFCLRFTDAKHAIPSSYGELCQRLAQLHSQQSVVRPEIHFPRDLCKKMAFTQATAQLGIMEEEFNQRGLSWALARGYINAWTRLHRAEEAMIEVVPQEMVVAGALNDVLRLQGSKIDHGDDLVARIRQAIDVIDPSAKKYLQGAAATALPLVITTPSPLTDGSLMTPYSLTLEASGGTPPIHWSLSQSRLKQDSLPEGLVLSTDGKISGTPKTPTNGATSFTVRATDCANVTATKTFKLTIAAQPGAAATAVIKAPVADAKAINGTDVSCGDSAQARAVLRDVRCAINEFRDGCWNGLIIARNRLIATMMFTGMTAYVLLVIALISGAQQSAIAAASTFYLVGATIGLLNQLRGVSQSETAVEDYGLSTARLITMPLFCGLAAIGGVVLMAMPQMASSYSAYTAPLAITTPSQLDTGTYDKLYYQRIDAAGGTPPYSWSPGNGQLPAGMELKATGDLIAMLPNKNGSEKFTVTAKVKDSTESSVEKTFFLKFTSATKAAAKNQPSAKVATSPALQPLEDVFDLHKNLMGLLVAAIFGLTPGLLFDRLQQQTEKYKADLKSSEATNAKLQLQKT